MKAISNIILVLVLTITSACIYLIQIYLFKRPDDTVYYFFQDLAFVPFEAIVVTLVLNNLLNVMEKRRKMKKIHVIISAFFAEMGLTVISELIKFNQNNREFRQRFVLTDFNKSTMKSLKKTANEFEYKIKATPPSLETLSLILNEKKPFMISMLENSNLSEHDSFTDMLWAIFHVADELQSRGSIKDFSESVLDHLANDILRAYKAIIIEWVNYIKYLNDEYPFLYDAAIKKNPFIEVIMF